MCGALETPKRYHAQQTIIGAPYTPQPDNESGIRRFVRRHNEMKSARGMAHL